MHVMQYCITMQFFLMKVNFTVLYTILVVHLADFGVNTHSPM